MSTSVRSATETPSPSVDTEAPPPDAPPAPAAGSAVSSWNAHDAAAFAQADGLLSTDVTHLHFLVSQSDAKGALDALSTLSPQDFHQALGELDRSGKLETLLGKLSDTDKARFLEVAAEKGSISKEPGKAAYGKFDPPAAPTLYRHDATLPRAVNDLIHESSQEAVAAYKHQYDAYSDRYTAAVGTCTTLAQIRGLGAPAHASKTWELNDDNDRHSDFYRRDWNLTRSECGPLDAYKAVSDRMQELTGEHRDGSAWFEVSGDLQAGALAVAIKEGKPTHFGAVTPKQSLGTYLTTKVIDGKVEQAAQLSGPQFSAGGTLTTKGDTVTKASASVSLKSGPGASVAIEPDGLTLNLTATKLDLGDGNSGKLSSYAKGSASQLHGGVQLRLQVGSLIDYKASIGVGLQGISAGTLARQAAKEGIFTLPHELEEHRGWNELSATRKNELQSLGWTEQEWKAAS